MVRSAYRNQKDEDGNINLKIASHHMIESLHQNRKSRKL
jgi:hypothetical protein